jgi:hypothetical protein
MSGKKGKSGRRRKDLGMEDLADEYKSPPKTSLRPVTGLDREEKLRKLIHKEVSKDLPNLLEGAEKKTLIEELLRAGSYYEAGIVMHKTGGRPVLPGPSIFISDSQIAISKAIGEKAAIWPNAGVDSKVIKLCKSISGMFKGAPTLTGNLLTHIRKVKNIER